MSANHAALAATLALLVAFGGFFGLYLAVRRGGPVLHAPTTPDIEARYRSFGAKAGPVAKRGMVACGVLLIAGVLAVVLTA